MPLKNTFTKNLLPLSISISGCLYGYNIGAIAGILFFIKQQMMLSNGIASLFVSTFLWGIVLSMLGMGVFAEKIGRKKTLLLGACVEIISILLMASAQGIYQLMWGRLLIGVSCGLMTLTVPLYLSEILPSAIRGRGTVAYQLFLTFGILLATLICWAFLARKDWRMIILIELIPAMLILFLSFFIPESPRWLCLRGKKREALEVLKKNYSPMEAGILLEEISLSQTRDQGTSRLKIIFKREYFFPLFLAITLGVLNQLTGVNAFLQYDVSILLSAGFQAHHEAFAASALITGVNFAMTLIAIFIVDHVERKNLLRMGLAGIFLSLGSAGFFMLLISDPHARAVLVGVALFMFIIFFSLAPGALVWTLRAEVLPAKIRAIGLSVSLILSSSAGALFSSLFLPIQAHIGLSGIFFFCAFISLIYFFISAFLPRTNHRSLEEIEASNRSG